MKIFQYKEIKQAIQYSKDGGQSLHLHRVIANKKKAPTCFVKSINNGQYIAHLFDQNKERLIATVKELGVNKILIEREDTDKQHVDLCGKPLEKAIRII